MALRDEELHKLIECILNTHQDDQIDCETCGRDLDCLAERVAAGADLHDLFPEVEAHLACCPDCFEEFQALVAILRAEYDGELGEPG